MYSYYVSIKNNIMTINYFINLYSVSNSKIIIVKINIELGFKHSELLGGNEEHPLVNRGNRGMGNSESIILGNRLVQLLEKNPFTGKNKGTLCMEFPCPDPCNSFLVAHSVQITAAF